MTPSPRALRRILCLGLALAALPLVVSATPDDASKDVDWAQWRGPDLDGITTETDWLSKWPRVRIKELWTRDVGYGYSASSVVGDRLYTAGFSKGQDTVYCFDLEKGKPLWGYQYPARNFDNMNAGGPSATPCVTDGVVITVSREAVVHAFDAKAGKVLWKTDMVKEVGAAIPTWGFSGSVIVHDGTAYLDVGVLMAMDPKTGKLKWKTRNYGSGYSTPVPFDQGGKAYLCCFPASGVVILERESGAEVATYEWKTSYDVNAATPLIHDGKIFISSGYNTGCAMLEFDGKALKELWKNKEMRNHMASCVWHEGYLYGFDESLLKCIDMDGKEVWKQRGLGKGSLVMAGGTLVVLSDRGELLLSEASPKGFDPKVRTKVLKDSGCWSAPVISQGKIVVRSPQGQLTCLSAR